MTKEPQNPDRPEPESRAKTPSRPQVENNTVDSIPEIRLRLGRRLRLAREHKKIELPEVATKLRIQKNYLAALEEGDWDKLPGPVYAFGFLRQYADFLEEEIPAGLLSYLKAEGGRLTKSPAIPDPPIAPGRKWAIAAAVVFIGLFLAFNLIPSDERKSPTGETEKVKPVLPAADKTETAIPPPAAGPEAKTGIQQDRPLADSTDAKASASVSDASPPVSTPLLMHRYILHAVGATTWLQVRDPEGQLIRDVLLQPGQKLVLKREDPFLLLTCGNAVAMEIEVDGVLLTAAGTLGEEGQVIRDFRITAPARAEEQKQQL